MYFLCASGVCLPPMGVYHFPYVLWNEQSCKFLSIMLAHAGTACSVHGQEMLQHTEISIYFGLKSLCITCAFRGKQSPCSISVCNPWRLFSLKSPPCCVSGLWQLLTFPPRHLVLPNAGAAWAWAREGDDVPGPPPSAVLCLGPTKWKAEKKRNENFSLELYHPKTERRSEI